MPRELPLFAIHLGRMKAKLAAQVIKTIKAHPDLAARFRLLIFLPGAGPIVAATLVVRMPELGAMRGQAASLIAPFDRDSGQYKGLCFIGGGRGRPRRMLYLAAGRCDPGLKPSPSSSWPGKSAKLVIAAVMR
jgi:transposase